MNDINSDIAALAARIRGIERATVGKPALIYFDIVGIAWPIRCMLHLGDVDHDLVQIDVMAWNYRDAAGGQVIKRCFRNGHVPRYVDHDVDLNDSRLILDHLAERTGLMPASRDDRIRVAEVIGHGYDCLFSFRGMLPVMVKIAIEDDIVQRRLDAFMGRGQFGLVTGGYDENLRVYDGFVATSRSPGGFLVGDTLSVADLHAFNILCNWYKSFDRDAFVRGYPRLDAYIRFIAGQPRVREYIDRHQEATTWFPLPSAAIRLTTPAELQGLV